jgi:IS5 family transposase
MQTTTNAQMGLLDSLMIATPTNEFLARLDRTLDWEPVAKALQAMYPATTGRPPCAPLGLFKMSLLQHCYGLSDPQCEELVSDRLSWRRFVGLGLQEAVPDETTLVRFRQRLREHGLHEKLLALVNRQLQAARRAPAKGDRTGGDDDAGYTVKQGQPHYGYKAHVSVDETHTLIRAVTLTAANVHDSQEFENVVKGDEEMVMADKAYWSQSRSEWCGRNGVANGILRKSSRGEKLKDSDVRMNRLFSSIRCQIEKVFGWWKRCSGYRRVRYVGRERNRLELEFKCVCWNLKRLTNLIAA